MYTDLEKMEIIDTESYKSHISIYEKCLFKSIIV